MRLNKIIQKDYTSFSLYYQIKLPLDLEISIPSDDPVRLVSAFVEEMDLSELYKTYGRIRKNQATPRQMLKLVIYAAMNRIYSSRDIREAWKRDINFMYLLEGMPAPDHATIARFISLHFSACAKVLLAQMSDLLYLLGEISGKTIFIDGTKIESAANKYTFVWKRAITKNQARLYTKLTSFVAECEELYGIRTVYHDQISIHTLKRLKKQLCRVKVQEGMVFVHGIGRRKTQLQKSLERITSEYGTMLRMNRSIQAEGSFADVKEGMNFRRYLYRGKANALAESILLAMGRNINKLHCKIQTGRTGSYLFPLKRA